MIVACFVPGLSLPYVSLSATNCVGKFPRAPSNAGNANSVDRAHF